MCCLRCQEIVRWSLNLVVSNLPLHWSGWSMAIIAHTIVMPCHAWSFSLRNLKMHAKWETNAVGLPSHCHKSIADLCCGPRYSWEAEGESKAPSFYSKIRSKRLLWQRCITTPWLWRVKPGLMFLHQKVPGLSCRTYDSASQIHKEREGDMQAKLWGWWITCLVVMGFLIAHLLNSQSVHLRQSRHLLLVSRYYEMST